MASTCVFRTKFTTRYTTWSATRTATWHPRTWPTSHIWSRSLRKRWGCTRPYRCLPDNSRRTSKSVSRIYFALTCRPGRTGGKGEGLIFPWKKPPTAIDWRRYFRETRGSYRTNAALLRKAKCFFLEQNVSFFSVIFRIVFFRNIPPTAFAAGGQSRLKSPRNSKTRSKILKI